LVPSFCFDDFSGPIRPRAWPRGLLRSLLQTTCFSFQRACARRSETTAWLLATSVSDHWTSQWPCIQARSSTSTLEAKLSHGPNRFRYSSETMNAFTISALTKFPPNEFSLPSQKLKPSKLESGASFGLRRM